jgi:nucleoside-diphosphate-sugar epimerase
LDSILPDVDRVVFLAFDVGGAKYMASESGAYIDNNLLILYNTFASLKKSGTPFIHTTSTMSNMNHTAYGLLKRLGEFYTEELGGINLKLWNVYGPEPIGIKSHVIPDLIEQAVSGNAIRLRSSGREERMFLHADDFARGVLAVSDNYSVLRNRGVIDISSTEWTSILTIAHLIRDIAKTTLGKDVDVIPTNTGEDSHTKRNDPDLTLISAYWSPRISLNDGIGAMFAFKHT